MQQFTDREWKTEGPLAVVEALHPKATRQGASTIRTVRRVGPLATLGQPKPEHAAATDAAEEILRSLELDPLPLVLLETDEAAEPNLVPSEATETPEKTSPKAATTPDTSKVTGKATSVERTFAVAYRGRFIGVFEAENKTTPRKAFDHVAGKLAAEQEDFDPSELQLYKLVHLLSACSTPSAPIVRGHVELFGEPSTPPQA